MSQQAPKQARVFQLSSQHRPGRLTLSSASKKLASGMFVYTDY